VTVLNPGDKQSELGAVREIVSKLSPPVSPDTSPHRNEMSLAFGVSGDSLVEIANGALY